MTLSANLFLLLNQFPFNLQVSKLENKEGTSLVEDVDWFAVSCNYGN